MASGRIGDFWGEEGSGNASVWYSTAVDAVEEIGVNVPDPSSIAVESPVKRCLNG